MHFDSGQAYPFDLMRFYMGEIIFLLLFAGISVTYFTQTFGYSTPLLDNSGGPALFPRIICIALCALIVIRIIQIISRKKYEHFHFFELFKGSTGMFSISTIVMILLIPYLGFLVTCFLFLTFSGNALFYIKQKSFGKGWQIALRELLFLAFVIGLYLFFTHILYVALPAGILKGIL